LGETDVPARDRRAGFHLIASGPFKTREVDMQFPRRSTTAVTFALVALTWLAAADAHAQDFPSTNLTS
jgi:hypothetical protein